MAKPSKKDDKSVQKTDKAGRSLSPFEEMDRMFAAMMPRAWRQPMRWEWPSVAEMTQAFEGRMPKVDVIDRDNEVVVRAEVPGVRKDDLDVSVTDNTVTLRGCTSHETKEDTGDYYRREMSRGEFARTVTLPSDVDSAKARATYSDGVLELNLPKVSKAKRRSIKVE